MKTKSVYWIFLLVVGTLITISCNKPVQTPLTVDECMAIEDTIRQLARIVENGANNLDIDASFDLFSDDPDFTFSEDGYILPPKDSLYRIMKPTYANWSNISMRYDTMRVSVLDRNSGVFTGEGPWSVSDNSGNEFSGHLVSMFVFARRNGKWQMIHGHTSHTFD